MTLVQTEVCIYASRGEGTPRPFELVIIQQLIIIVVIVHLRFQQLNFLADYINERGLHL